MSASSLLNAFQEGTPEECIDILAKLHEYDINRVIHLIVERRITASSQKIWEKLFEEYFPLDYEHVAQSRKRRDWGELFIFKYHSQFKQKSLRSRAIYHAIVFRQDTIVIQRHDWEHLTSDFLYGINLLYIASVFKHQWLLDKAYAAFSEKERSIDLMIQTNQVELVVATIKQQAIDLKSEEGSRYLLAAINMHHKFLVILLVKLGARPISADLAKAKEFELMAYVIERAHDVDLNLYHTHENGEYNLLDIAVHHSEPLFNAIVAHPSMKQYQADHAEQWIRLYACSNTDERKMIMPYLQSLAAQEIQLLTHDDLPITTDFPVDERLVQNHFQDFPRKEIWRLFYDGMKQCLENGWVDFEKREPGYQEAMTYAFIMMSQTITEELTTTIIMDMHMHCTQDVHDTSKGAIPGIFRDNTAVMFGLGKRNNYSCTLSGLLELHLLEESQSGIQVKNSKENIISVYTARRTRSQITSAVAKTIADYHVAIQEATTKIDELDAIIQLVTTLERIHPFGDGNCRTFAMILMNRELMRQGLSPVIMNNPNIINGYSQRECRSEVIRGMHSFQLVKQGKTDHLGKGTDECIGMLTGVDDYCSTIKQENDQVLAKAGIGKELTPGLSCT